MQPPQENQGVVYEVNLEADADIAGPFDTWLRDHIADMLQFEGFRSAEILDDPSAPAGRITALDLPGQVGQAEELGIVTPAEAEFLREYDRKVMDLVNVDDFASEELMAGVQAASEARPLRQIA